jgi:hypothetical protein
VGAVFRWNFSKIFRQTPIFWLLGGVGLLALVWRRGKGDRLFLYGLFLFSALAVCPGFYFRRHYFVLLLPAVSLLIGAAAVAARDQLAGKFPRLAWVVPSVVVVAAAVYSVADEFEFFCTATPAQAVRLVYGTNPFPEALQAAQYIRERSTKDDRILVLGSEPEICFYADRLSATGHIYMYGLMEEQPYALQMQQELIREVEAARPAFIVKCNVDMSWLRDPNAPMLIFDWMDAYIDAGYELVGLFDIRDPSTAVFASGESVSYYSRHADRVIFLYRRKKLASMGADGQDSAA